jgi:hypothetical protein
MTAQAMLDQILVTNNFLAVPSSDANVEPAGERSVATVLANIAYYGFVPGLDAVQAIQALSVDGLTDFWLGLEPILKEMTGANRNMTDVVVYKNFPKEVLDMTRARYWVNQLFMYLGAPNAWFAQDEVERAPLNESLRLKVLALAGADTLATIRAGLVANKTRWTDVQRDHALVLARALPLGVTRLSDFGFKENGVRQMAATLDVDQELDIPDATDVLRLAAAMSGEDVSLRTKVLFRRFNRAERRMMLGLLEVTKNLQADMAMRPTEWKHLLSALHPGDYKFPLVSNAYNALYRGDLTTFNSQVETHLAKKDVAVLRLLQSRPGEFARRLHSLYGVFGQAAVTAFASVVDKLDTSQVLKLKSYVSAINGRKTLMYPPRGNWSKIQVVENTKVSFDDASLAELQATLAAVLGERMAAAFPEGVAMAIDVENVKLQTSDQELAPYGRGTVFEIPAQMQFLRTASYWEHPTDGRNTWFDNGWAFFGEDWTSMGACCWNAQKFEAADDVGAVFSGDPTNSKDLMGRGCQMIDLYLDKLAAAGVRYAVWNVLCYSNVAFKDANEVLATLQWGEHAEEGALFEPARAQMVFPLKGEAMTKYVAYVDVKSRKLVYMDANLPGRVDSMTSNLTYLTSQMPAYVEYLNALPSVADLFIHAPQAEAAGATAVLYSDAGHDLPQGTTAYVFKPENASNQFEKLALEPLLGAMPERKAA